MNQRNKITNLNLIKIRLLTFLQNLKKALNLNIVEKSIIKNQELTMNTQTQKLRYDQINYLKCKATGQAKFSKTLEKPKEPKFTYNCQERPKRKYDSNMRSLLLFDPEATCQDVDETITKKNIILDRDHLNQFYDEKNKIKKLNENNLTQLSNEDRIKQFEKSGKINLKDVFDTIVSKDLMFNFNSTKTDLAIPYLIQQQQQGVDLCQVQNQKTLLDQACFLLNSKAIAFLILVAECKIETNSLQSEDSLMPPHEDAQECIDQMNKEKKMPNGQALQPKDVIEQKMEHAKSYFTQIVKMHGSFWDLYKYSEYLDLTKGVWQNCDWKNAVFNKGKYIDVSQRD